MKIIFQYKFYVNICFKLLAQIRFKLKDVIILLFVNFGKALLILDFAILERKTNILFSGAM